MKKNTEGEETPELIGELYVPRKTLAAIENDIRTQLEIVEDLIAYINKQLDKIMDKQSPFYDRQLDISEEMEKFKKNRKRRGKINGGSKKTPRKGKTPRKNTALDNESISKILYELENEYKNLQAEIEPLDILFDMLLAERSPLLKKRNKITKRLKSILEIRKEPCKS